MVGPQFQADLSNLHLNRHGEKSKWGLDPGGDREKKMKTVLQSRRNLLHIQSDLVPQSSEGSGWLRCLPCASCGSRFTECSVGRRK